MIEKDGSIRKCYCCGSETTHVTKNGENWYKNKDLNTENIIGYLCRRCYRNLANPNLIEQSKNPPKCENCGALTTDIGKHGKPRWFRRYEIKDRIAWDCYACMTSKVHTGLKRSEETIQNLVKSHLGKCCSPAGEFKKGHNTWNKGKTGIYSEETLQKMRVINKKNWNTPEKKEYAKLRRLEQKFNKSSKEELAFGEYLMMNGIAIQNEHSNRPKLGTPDFFIAPNIVVFYDGDHWHANPNYKNGRYRDDNTVVYLTRTAKQIREYDEWVTASLILKGYAVIRFWASDTIKDREGCLAKLKALIDKVNS